MKAYISTDRSSGLGDPATYPHSEISSRPSMIMESDRNSAMCLDCRVWNPTWVSLFSSGYAGNPLYLENSSSRNLTRQALQEFAQSTQCVAISSESLHRFLCQFAHLDEGAMRFLNQSSAGQSFGAQRKQR
jgi:hypothetical protein